MHTDREKSKLCWKIVYRFCYHKRGRSKMLTKIKRKKTKGTSNYKCNGKSKRCLELSVNLS